MKRHKTPEEAMVEATKLYYTKKDTPIIFTKIQKYNEEQSYFLIYNFRKVIGFAFTPFEALVNPIFRRETRKRIDASREYFKELLYANFDDNTIILKDGRKIEFKNKKILENFVEKMKKFKKLV